VVTDVMIVTLSYAVNSEPDSNAATTRMELFYGSKMAEGLSTGHIIKVSFPLTCCFCDRVRRRTLVTSLKTSCRSTCAVD